MTQRDRGGLARLRHDLRTCVNHILGYSELLREDAEQLQPQFVPDLDHIHASGRRVLTLLDDLFSDTPTAGALDAPAATAQPAAAAADESAEDGARILVVDDNEMNRDMLSRRLGRHGFNVARAVDGPDALRRLSADAFDLVLLDWMMPGMSGLDVLAALRREYTPAELPVVMATAKAESEDVVVAFDAGANDYVMKPFDFPVVLARVRTQLAMKRAVDENRRLLRDLEIRNRFIRQTFGRYLTEDIVAGLLDDRSGLDIGGEKRRISILMTDLRGFSSMAERMEPDQVVRLLNTCFDVMTPIIMECGGTIDEFIGDAILVFFNAPARRPDHARAAVRCAVRMQIAMAEVNRRNDAHGLPALEMGIGINTGDVVVGNIGSELRAKYGAVGSNVNLAGRVESYTVGGQILVAESTWHEAAPVALSSRTLEVRPKGFTSPIRLYEIDGVEDDPPLRVPGGAIDPVPLAVPIPAALVVLADKDAGGVAHPCEIVGISPDGAELSMHAGVERLANVCLRISHPPAARGAPAASPPLEIYAKVVALDAGAARVQLRFTALTAGAAAWIRTLLA